MDVMIDEYFSTADLERWISMLPLGAQAELARGPIDEEDRCGRPMFERGESCRVCKALRPYAHLATWHMYLLVEWHNAITKPDEEWYLRCLMIYLVAGWDGT